MQNLEHTSKKKSSNKSESGLVNTVEKYVNDVRAAGISILVPKTMVDQEVAVRVQNLKERMGGEDRVQQYFKQL